MIVFEIIVYIQIDFLLRRTGRVDTRGKRTKSHTSPKRSPYLLQPTYSYAAFISNHSGQLFRLYRLYSSIPKSLVYTGTSPIPTEWSARIFIRQSYPRRQNTLTPNSIVRLAGHCGGHGAPANYKRFLPFARQPTDRSVALRFFCACPVLTGLCP